MSKENVNMDQKTINELIRERDNAYRKAIELYELGNIPDAKYHYGYFFGMNKVIRKITGYN
ncbi:MAG: hypothetical protein V3U54_13085 [Thermodesulfobacteriota bacterium]